MRYIVITCAFILTTVSFTQSKTKYTVDLPTNYNENNSYPLFLVLHGGYGNMKQISKKWKSNILKEKFVMVYLEASHLDSKPNKWGWRDVNKERKNIVTYYNEVVEKYSIDKFNIYIGGFSLGAKMSIDAVMNGAIPIKGILSICHGGQISPMVNASYLVQSIEREVGYVVVSGENDSNYKNESSMIKKLLEKYDGRFLYQDIDGLGHELPFDFKTKMDHVWLPFLMNN